MADDFRIQRYRSADRDCVFALLRAAYSDDFATRLIRQWDWKYDSHPSNREAEQARRINHEKLEPFIIKTYSAETLTEWGLSLDQLDALPDDAPYVLLLKDADKVVAMEGSLPQAFLVNGTRQLVSVQCDLAVHPDYRGRGLSMKLLLRIALEHGLTMSWSNLNSRRVGMGWPGKVSRQRSLSPTSRWGYVRVVPLVKPIDWAYLAHRATGIRLLGNAAAAVAAGARRLRSTLGKTPALPGVEVFQAESFDSRIDDLWHRASREHPVIGVRDQSYLNWRFGARPDASYIRLIATRGSNIIGYLVFRIAEQEGERWGYIVDFLVEANDTSVFELMLLDAEQRMTREGVKGVVCVIAMPPLRGELRRQGFYPAFFRTPAYLGGSVTSPDPDLKVYAEVRKWFVTSGDGDVEMSF